MLDKENGLFSKKTRWYNLDFLKFLFSLIIVYYHILHANIMDFVGDVEKYAIWQQKSNDAGIMVEMFLIIAGFFLYLTIRKENIEIGEFVLSKIFRLWPVLFISIFLSALLYRRFTYPMFLNSLFLQCIGLSLDYKGITWYISPFFWSQIFYFILIKSSNNKKMMNLFVSVIVYFSYALNINYMNGGFGRETIGYVFSLGFLRCLASMGMGYLIAMILDYIYSTKYIRFFEIQNKVISKILFSVIEVVTLGFIVKYTVFAKMNYSNRFVFVIVFAILFISFVQKKGFVSDCFEVLGKSGVGKYIYSIYVMQQFSFDILKKTLWLKNSIVEKELLCVLISIGFAVFVGIVVYYVIEKPFVKFYKVRINKMKE